MKPLAIFFLSLFSLFFFHLSAQTHLSTQTRQSAAETIFKGIQPSSIADRAALIHLYPLTESAQRACLELVLLLQGGVPTNRDQETAANLLAFHSYELVEALSTTPWLNRRTLTLKVSQLIGQMCHWLPNRSLKGYEATTEEVLLELPEDQIEITRALQIVEGELNSSEALCDEALLDLYAAQVWANLKYRLHRMASCSKEEMAMAKIDAINQLLFSQLGVRYPPQSKYTTDVERYSSLSQVLNSRRGICLGTCLLYAALAQRVGLQLSILTPPGHILLRWQQGGRYRNIETTAAGAHLDDERYKGIEEKQIEGCDKKELIGLALFNKASSMLHKGDYREALELYRRVKRYRIDEKSTLLLHGLCALSSGFAQEGRAALQRLIEVCGPDPCYDTMMAEDVLQSRIEPHTLIELMLLNDHAKGAELADAVKRAETIMASHPQCRLCYPVLAELLLKAHRQAEALNCLVKYQAFNPADLNTFCLLIQLFAERCCLLSAWSALEKAEEIAQKKSGAIPLRLSQLRMQLLTQLSP